MAEQPKKANGGEETDEVVITYDYAKDYRVVPSNGCFGGLTPRGDLIINFFEEAYPLPKAVTHEITPQGTLGAEKSRHIDANLVRHVQVAIVLAPHQAESIGQWILRKIEEAKKRSGERK